MTHINLQKPLNVCRASAGTGKTYTLAAYYIGLLLSDVDYRSILAVTFTNNATSEMKERIMGYLYQLKTGQNQAFLEYSKNFMVSSHPNETDNDLRDKAGKCFERMLLDYDNVHVQTIDSLLLTLQSGLAAMLKMSAGYEPELDSKRVIIEAVDQMLSKDGMTEAAKELLLKYVTDNLSDEKKSDIRQTLIKMAENMYNESVQKLETERKILFDPQAIETYCNRLDAMWANNEDIPLLKQELEKFEAEMQRCGESLTPPHNRDPRNGYERLKKSLENPAKMDKSKRFKGVTTIAKNSPIPPLAAEILLNASEIASRCLEAYNTIKLTKEFAHELQLMSELREIIRQKLVDANKTLLAKTASILKEALKDGDADFILEKVGIRYHHVLLDEFQDTSKLQWEIFDLLIKELAAGEGNSILVVGDIKQSIYRWRNGDWHTMDELGKTGFYEKRLNTEFPQLIRNFRSSKEVVSFNLSLFKYIYDNYSSFEYASDDIPTDKEIDQIKEIYNEGFQEESKDNLSAYYRSKEKEYCNGYVCFKVFKQEKGEKKAQKEARMVADMFVEIEKVLKAGIPTDKIMILVRNGLEADTIVNQYNKIVNKDEFEKLSKVSFATESSFQLSASQDIQLIIAILHYLTDEQEGSIYEEVITKLLPNCELSELGNQIQLDAPLFELISDIIRLYLCDETGKYKNTEQAYLDAFLDYLRSYIASGGGRVKDFLTYWDDILNEKPIPMETAGAIRIMTIHKSKGLEAQTLFVPFCNWEIEISSSKNPRVWCESILNAEGQEKTYMPIQYGSEMKVSSYTKEYQEERHNLRIDNLNLLYVALTRAKDNLFVYTDCSIDSKGKLSINTVGKYLLNFEKITVDAIQDKEVIVREYGELTKPHGSNNSESPFEFSNAPQANSALWSDGRQVRFVQSEEGQLFTAYGEEADRLVERRNEGSLCHDIFSQVHTLDELDQVLDDFEGEGKIDSSEQREKLKQLISSAWNGNEKVRGWFTDPWKLALEKGIFDNHREHRPDRVMIDEANSHVIVLDYKFGVFSKLKHKKYESQVLRYMRLMRDFGYQNIEGYLWYAQNEKDNQLIEVKTTEEQLCIAF